MLKKLAKKCYVVEKVMASILVAIANSTQSQVGIRLGAHS
jgi:hypothetical protein